MICSFTELITVEIYPKMADFIRWPIFSLLNDEILDSIKLACVFGSSGNEAIFVTHDDDVFVLGSNLSSCLGTGDSQSCLQPRKVDALCKKRLSYLAFGTGPHVMALNGNYIKINVYDFLDHSALHKDCPNDYHQSSINSIPQIIMMIHP